MSLGAFERLVARDARANARRRAAVRTVAARASDQRGMEVLALPAGFSYVTFSHSGSKMSDGHPTPLALDGMGSFDGARDGHGQPRARAEPAGAARAQQRGPQPRGHVGGLLGDRSKAYDPTGYGGTTTVVYDEHRRQLVRTS